MRYIRQHLQSGAKTDVHTAKSIRVPLPIHTPYHTPPIPSPKNCRHQRSTLSQLSVNIQSTLSPQHRCQVLPPPLHSQPPCCACRASCCHLLPSCCHALLLLLLETSSSCSSIRPCCHRPALSSTWGRQHTTNGVYQVVLQPDGPPHPSTTLTLLHLPTSSPPSPLTLHQHSTQ